MVLSRGNRVLANNCLLARVVEQGVRFVQLFDWVGFSWHGEDQGHSRWLTKKVRRWRSRLRR